jgi:hypothetical protein
MAIVNPDLDQMSVAISHATAPAFMLGAVAAFLSILISRLERIVDHVRALRATQSTESAEIVALHSRRMILLNHAIFFAVLSGLCTAALLIVAFMSALFGINHRNGVALMFTLALLLLIVALVNLTREVRLNIKAVHLEA